MAALTQETQELVSPDSEELLVAPDSEELVAPELLASYLSSSDEATAAAKGKSTGKPAMEFTPESELDTPDERHAAKEQKNGPPARKSIKKDPAQYYAKI